MKDSKTILFWLLIFILFRLSKEKNINEIYLLCSSPSSISSNVLEYFGSDGMAWCREMLFWVLLLLGDVQGRPEELR